MQFVNNFRGIAILLVILIHAVSIVERGDSTVLFLLNNILKNCTVLFVVVAGYLFSFQVVGFNYKRFLTSKITTVVIPYIVISVPAILLYIFNLKSNHHWINMEWFSEQNALYQYIYFMVTGAHLGPLWFIPMILIMYLFSPVIILLKNNNWLSLGFFISLIPAFYWGRPELNENVIQAFIYFLPAYLLGVLIQGVPCIYKITNKFSALILIMFLGLYSIIGNYIQIDSSTDLLFKLFLAISVLSFCSYYLTAKNKILDMFARLSFFLFFIHGYFAGFFRVINNRINVTGYEFIYVIGVFFMIVISCLFAFVLIKLIFEHKSKKWIGI